VSRRIVDAIRERHAVRKSGQQDGYEWIDIQNLLHYIDDLEERLLASEDWEPPVEEPYDSYGE
jgi:hypothetical protein